MGSKKMSNGTPRTHETSRKEPTKAAPLQAGPADAPMGDAADATQHAREAADANKKEEAKIAIAVGERYAVVDKGLEAVVQEHIGRAAAATKKLMASLVAGVQHVKEYVMQIGRAHV